MNNYLIPYIYSEKNNGFLSTILFLQSIDFIVDSLEQF